MRLPWITAGRQDARPVAQPAVPQDAGSPVLPRPAVPFVPQDGQDVLPQDAPSRGTDNADRTPVPFRPVDQDAANGTPVPQDAGQDAQDDGTNVPRDADQRPAGRLATWRAHRAGRREARQQDAQVAQDAERAARLTAQDAVAAAGRSRPARPAASRRTPEDVIAPVPGWMQVWGIWIGRTFGQAPLVAPMLVSGIFTTISFADVPMPGVPGWVKVVLALLASIALEGALYKSVQNYVQTLLNNDSTVGDRAVIGLLLTLIGAVIGSHAYLMAWKSMPHDDRGVDALVKSVDWVGWMPAAVASAMALVGVLVTLRAARTKYRAQLIANELVDRRAPKFAALSWCLRLFPTFFDLLHATRYRIESPSEAARDRREWKAAGRPDLWPLPVGYGWEPTGRTLLGRRTGRLFEKPVPQDARRDEQDAVPQDGRSPIIVPSRTAPERPVLSGPARQDDRTPVLPVPSHVLPIGNRTTGRQDVPQDAPITRDAQDARRDADGTPTVVPQDEAVLRDVPQDDRTEQDAARIERNAQALTYAFDLQAVFRACPNWRQQPPPLRSSEKRIGLIEIVNDSRVSRGKGTFNSASQAQKIRSFLESCNEDSELLELVLAATEPAPLIG